MSPCEQVLADLIHDLAQPLGNIETSAYCLELALDPHNVRAQEQLRLIQQQLEQATSMLAAAAAGLGRPQSPSFALTAVAPS